MISTHTRPCGVDKFPSHRLPWIYFGLVVICVAVVFGSAARADDTTTASGQPIGPLPAKRALGPDGRLRIQRSDRCPLCAMLPARYPEYSCGLELADKRTYYFCCPRCLLRAWSAPKRFLNVAGPKITRITVRHYFSGEQISGRSALWVSGSNVIGPMGPALIPLKTQAEAAAFKRRHGAKRVFRLNELTRHDRQKILGPQP